MTAVVESGLVEKRVAGKEGAVDSGTRQVVKRFLCDNVWVLRWEH